MARKLKGVKCRGSDRKPYFEMRCGDTKLYSLQIKTEEEGALAYDIVRLHIEKRTEGVVGAKRKFARDLNYPEYSRSMPLHPVLSHLDIEHNKGTALPIILGVARAAAANLPESLKRSTPAVGDPSPSNRSSSHQNDHWKLPDVSEGKQDLPTIKVLETFPDISMHKIHECYLSLFSKLEERQDLERMVAGIEEGSGFISIPGPGPEMFDRHMACLKSLLEQIEQSYNSEASKCWNLLKKLEDYNFKALEASLVSSENGLAGRQRSSESERFPHVPEPCRPEEQDDFGVPVGESETCGPPASFPAIVTPGGTHTIMAPVQMDMSQPVGLLESEIFAGGSPHHTGCLKEDIEEWFEELRSSNNGGSPHSSDYVGSLG